jgi:ureidoacrylate peracid hydrolase
LNPVPLTGDRTALIVVDMQNAYLSPQGSFSRLWAANGKADSRHQMDVGVLRRSIPGCKRLIESARKASVPVVYLAYVYRPDYQDGGVLIREINPALRDVGYVADGTWDAEIINELKPQQSDFVIKKARYSGFHATTLETVLRSLHIEALVMCGVTTHFCVECTGRDAHMRDYRVVIASDATEEVNEAWKQMALASFRAGFGWVSTVSDIVDCWELR